MNQHHTFFISRSAALLALCIVALVASSLCYAQPVSLKASNAQPQGWGIGGWGSYRFVLHNPSPTEATIVSWSAHWEANGKQIGAAFGGDINQKILAGKDVTRDETGVLPEDAVKAARPKLAHLVGQFVVNTGTSTVNLPYDIEIKEFILAEPLKEVDGKMVGMELMTSRYRNFKHIDRTLKWMDESYSAMIDLTGERPYGGKRMIYLESPPHPWWAYAGQKMILNTEYVGETLKHFDDGLVEFGWVHEVGHNFDDPLGKWYIWSGPAAEFQANFKLAYAFENIPDQSFRMKWVSEAAGYPAPDKNIRLTGHEFVDKFFMMFGDEYLADSNRKWDSLTSDEIHTLFQRIQVVYGWEPFKRWYRTYRRLEDAGQKPPEKAEDKVSLIAAILSYETKVDLTPLFVMWRFPINADSVKLMKEKYKIGG